MLLYVAHLISRRAFDAKYLVITVVSVDVTDISGELQTDLQHNIQKTRLSSIGEKVDVLATNGKKTLNKSIMVDNIFF